MKTSRVDEEWPKISLCDCYWCSSAKDDCFGPADLDGKSTKVFLQL